MAHPANFVLGTQIRYFDDSVLRGAAAFPAGLWERFSERIDFSLQRRANESNRHDNS